MDRTFFITSVTAQRRALFQRTAAADLLVDVFLGYREMGKYLLHDFAIMPEHFHALITPAPEISLERAVQVINRSDHPKPASDYPLKTGLRE
ncbi:MAG: transposase [Terriglobales bacterium]